jgi:hypothetical protein
VRVAYGKQRLLVGSPLDFGEESRQFLAGSQFGAALSGIAQRNASV